MPEISVIVPVYNVENYLKRCVNSILDQSFADFELILVDDGSTDKSGEICDGYAAKDARVRVLHQENGGAAAARNAGLDFVFSQSNSKWITFVDGDDWICRNYLKNLYTTVTENRLDFAVCRIVRVTDEAADFRGEDLSFRYDPPDDFWADEIMTASSPCAKLYAKHLLKEIRFPQGKRCEDMFVMHKILFSFEQLAFLTSPMYFYYFNLSSASNRLNWFQKLDYIEALTEQCEFFNRNQYPRAEATAAYSLFCAIVSSLKEAVTYPPAKHKTRYLRKQLRLVCRKYRHALNLSDGNGKKTFFQLAHPFLYKLKRKWNHFFH